jgi:hypothetical protein
LAVSTRIDIEGKIPGKLTSEVLAKGGRMLELIRAMQNLGSFFVFASVVVVLVGLVVFAPYARRRFFGEVEKETSSGASAAFTAIVTFSVFILGSSLVSVQSNMTKMEDAVNKEASILRSVNETILESEDPDSKVLQGGLFTYTQLIVSEEWPAMRIGERSAAADAAYLQMMRQLVKDGRQHIRTDERTAAMQEQLDDAGELREQRLSHTGLSLSPLYWSMIIVLLGLLIVLASFNECSREQMLKTGGIMVALSLFIGLIVTYETPFNGDVSIQATPFANALKDMKAEGVAELRMARAHVAA